MSIPGPADGIGWVTGASSGIGREVAAQFARAGWVVAISAPWGEALQSLAEGYPGRMIVAPLDMTDAEAVRDCVARSRRPPGRKWCGRC